MSKGRDKELIRRRDEALCRRWLYWTEQRRLRFDDALRILSEQEFFLSEQRVLAILRRQARPAATTAGNAAASATPEQLRTVATATTDTANTPSTATAGNADTPPTATPATAVPAGTAAAATPEQSATVATAAQTTAATPEQPGTATTVTTGTVATAAAPGHSPTPGAAATLEASAAPGRSSKRKGAAKPAVPRLTPRQMRIVLGRKPQGSR